MLALRIKSIWNLSILGFCRTTKPSNGKLVLRTRSSCFVCTHYQTGEIIPIEFQKIKESSNFQEGMATMRQLSFGLLDMGWHGQDPSAIADIKAFENNLQTLNYILR
jgi:Zn-dependent oligopeptidase